VFLPVSPFERLALIGSLLLLILVEVLNTAVEVVVDRIGLERHALSGLAKDLGSAAVLIAMLMALMTWITVLYGCFSQAGVM